MSPGKAKFEGLKQFAADLWVNVSLGRRLHNGQGTAKSIGVMTPVCAA